MKKSNAAKRGLQDSNQLSTQPDKVGWIRKFCGRGIFREIWKNRFVMLKGDHLYIFEKEMKDDGKTHEVFDLFEYERSEELRKTKSRSKKSYSKFTLLRCRQPGNRTPNLVFLAVSPEEKESWINVLNAAILRAKNHRVFDEVTLEEESLCHPTRDRAKIPPGRRLPTRGHLMTVASTSSDGMLTLDLVHEEDESSAWGRDYRDYRVDLDKMAAASGSGPGPGRRRSGTDASKLRVTPAAPEGRVKTGSLPRGSEMSWSRPPPLSMTARQHSTEVHTPPAHARTPQPGKRAAFQGRSRCASMDDALSRGGGDRRGGGATGRARAAAAAAALAHSPTGHLQDLIDQRLQRTQELLAEIHEQDGGPMLMLHQRPRVDSAHVIRGGAEIHEQDGGPMLMLHQRPRVDSAHVIRGGADHGGGGVDSPRLRHLRGSDSPHSSSRGSGSPHSRSDKDSPRGGGGGGGGGKDSPRSSGSKGKESPRVKGSKSPRSGKAKDSSRGGGGGGGGGGGKGASDSPGGGGNGNNASSSSSRSPHLPHLRSLDLTHLRGSDSPLSTGSGSGGGGGGSGGPNSPHPKPRGGGGPMSELLLLKAASSPHLHLRGALRGDSPLREGKMAAGMVAGAGGSDWEVRRAAAERLLQEAISSWQEAREVLEEVKQLQERQRSAEPPTAAAAAVAATTTVTSSPPTATSNVATTVTLPPAVSSSATATTTTTKQATPPSHSSPSTKEP
ncbi:pleckstrin homology domain-containing family O member 1-A [Engraulis encrasicolus]|uniref:pleckstrin homology domain-containing family O member 1-A n=1 Tax=Engraulis encrasicolus TaxID=184585 RepID=UPI002FD548B1